MKIQKLYVNWRQIHNGEDYDLIEIGKHGVVSIIENKPINRGDLWNFLVTYEDGKIRRFFNPNQIDYL